MKRGEESVCTSTTLPKQKKKKKIVRVQTSVDDSYLNVKRVETIYSSTFAECAAFNDSNNSESSTCERSAALQFSDFRRDSRRGCGAKAASSPPPRWIRLNVRLVPTIPKGVEASALTATLPLASAVPPAARLSSGCDAPWGTTTENKRLRSESDLISALSMIGQRGRERTLMWLLGRRWERDHRRRTATPPTHHHPSYRSCLSGPWKSSKVQRISVTPGFYLREDPH